MANISSQKRMAAEIMKCGISRVRIEPGKDVEEALTREDIRNLIRKGLIWKVQKKGTSRAAARKILAQKKKGRRKGVGRRKGKTGALNPRKRQWVRNVTTLRRMIKELRDSGRIERRYYRRLYLLIKGNMFRSRKHVMLYMKEHDMLKKAERPAAKEKPAKVKPAKTTKQKSA